jgi:predicted kinase
MPMGDDGKARLVLINGAPATGKSTLARRYADAHPLTLALDIDAVLGMLGGWLDSPGEAGLLARRMAIEMARVHLGSGRDVLVPQYLGRLGFVLELEQLARDVGAEFTEIALISTPADVAARFARRSREPETAQHRDAAVLLELGGGLAALPALCERLDEVVASRPRTRTVTIADGDIERAVRDLAAALSR